MLNASGTFSNEPLSSILSHAAGKDVAAERWLSTSPVQSKPMRQVIRRETSLPCEELVKRRVGWERYFWREEREKKMGEVSSSSESEPDAESDAEAGGVVRGTGVGAGGGGV